MSNRNSRFVNAGEIRSVVLLFLACLFCLLLPLSLRSQSSPATPTLLPGQSATVLSDGRWLLVGGKANKGSLSTVSIWDPRSGVTEQLASQLQHARAYHTATMLPDGTVFIFGGVGPNGQVVNVAELFDPESQSLSALSSTGLASRARHTATLLTDGHVLIAGGVGANGQTLRSAEIFDPETQSSAPVTQSLSSPRRNHTATLLADGSVLIWGGMDGDGNPLNNGELFDPSSEGFTLLQSYPSFLMPQPSDGPILMASIPVDRSVDVSTESIISLRFSKPLRAETVNGQTVTLSGPKGVENIKVIPAENGSLAFITPDVSLLPGSTYTVTINGAVDRDGLLLPVSGISFSTEPLPSDGQPAGDPSNGTGPQPTGQPPPSGSGSDDGWTWSGQLKDGKPHSPWQDLPPLQADPGVTALAGQVLDLKGEPLANATLEIQSTEYGQRKVVAKTDETGRFLLTKIEEGWSKLLMDGRLGHNPQSGVENPKWGYGIFEYGLEIEEGNTNVLSFTIWLPKIDTVNVVNIPSPTVSEVVVTSPKIPGLELRLPPATVIYDREGKVVKEVGLTPIPLDRTPFPLAKNVEVPLYFTAQPGGAYLKTSGNIGARVYYPNAANKLPGTRFNFWHYDPSYRGWYIYGLGNVQEDGKQIIPDPGISVYEFTGAMVGPPGLGPPDGPPPCPDPENCKGGDPVDLYTGLLVTQKTDLFLPDVIPIQFTRTYRPRDTFSRAFGLGTNHSYDLFLVGDTFPYTFQDLILPDGGKIHYPRISPGTSWTDAVYEHTTSGTRFYKSQISWNGNGWDLKLKDGTVYVFDEGFGASRPGQSGLLSIRDRNGNALTVLRDANGNATKITSPNGRWIEFTNDTSNRITQATDNIGRTLTYSYDATGRLATVTDPNGGVTQYTYDTSSRMLTIKDPRQIVFLTNEYDTTGRVTKQTQADGSIYLFAYTTDANGKVVQTDVTDPRGNIRRVTFNGDGQIVTDKRAVGKPEEQDTTFELQTTTNLMLSVTDALNRKTAYAYDAMGNVISMTRLADTPDAVTKTYTHEPTFNQLTSVTDPLNHTTSFGYDSKGNLISVTNALNQTTTIAPNDSGQPISITDPLNNTTQFAYDFGDFSGVTDPVGNAMTRFTDAGGRVLSVTNPLGNPTIYDYDVLNRLTQVNDPLNGLTAFGYDPNGNLLSVTDARNSATTYTYENMDRLATRRDPLLRTESYQYDLAGNVSQFTDRKIQPTTYTYDGLNRRKGVTYADTSTTTYTYDKGNRLTQISDSIAGVITRTYDSLNRVTSETTPQGLVSYTYDAAGRRATMTVFGQPSVVYSYDNANRLTQITQGSAIVGYTYDTAGRRTSLTLPNGVLVEYGYDAASRLTSITYKQNGTTVLGDLTYEYDKAGNRTKTGGSFARTGIPQSISSTAYNAANHQTTFGDKTLTYDNNGNLLTVTDANGTTTYSWNARNQLAGISGPNVNAGFVYDGLGRREKKTVNGNLTEFLFDGVNPVQETSGATVLANILPGLRVDEFLTRTDVSSGTTSFFLADALGSPVAVTDAAGAVQTEYTYEPFGTTTSTGSSNTNPYQYTGRENDGTGLYYYRARYYNPALQRFISEDPIRFLSQELNFFGYVGNNPLLYIDPFGLCKKLDCDPTPPDCKTMDCTPKPPPPEPPCKTPGDCFPSHQGGGNPQQPPDYPIHPLEGQPCDSPGGCVYTGKPYGYGEPRTFDPTFFPTPNDSGLGGNLGEPRP